MPPFSRSSVKNRSDGGIVSAGLDPTRITHPVLGTSSSGNGSPRSRPNALVPAAAADDMQNRPL
ncbi:hypothetical protein GCM10018980_48300 [Streptomyces capoamus]|uniref:Uncharacterized protein n=1 Tax=Streptomyces capoamus TaxID=68183 RepID=A0A919KDJ9_9ACTN|nr:hypothetical protein GCM10018980_48300 [Streptomyces capoamus]